MQFKVYKEHVAGVGLQGVVEELLQLLRHGSPDARDAALDFSQTLKLMATRHQLLANPVARHLWMSLLGPSESLWAREVRRHTLYLSRTGVGSLPSAIEVRALLACNGLDPEPVRVQKAVDRHNRM